MAEMTEPDPTAFWRAVALVGLDRAAGLEALEAVFAGGRPPTDLRGPLRGGFVAATIARPIDLLVAAATSAWLPWKGKTFEPDAAAGRNLLTPGGRRLMQVALPRYRLTDEAPSRFGAFRFLTSTGPSAFTPEVSVLRIDYRDVPENPRWPIRKILDELVDVGGGMHLGQALFEVRGALRRVAWFSLARPLD